MSEANPYRPPAARVEDVVRPATDSGEFIDGGQALSAGRGWGWIAGGFRMFKSKPATWILITIVLGVIFIGMGLVPVLGALIFGMVQQGIVITGVDADWFQVFLGVMLVAAVIFNNFVRRRASEAR